MNNLTRARKILEALEIPEAEFDLVTQMAAAEPILRAVGLNDLATLLYSLKHVAPYRDPWNLVHIHRYLTGLVYDDFHNALCGSHVSDHILAARAAGFEYYAWNGMVHRVRDHHDPDRAICHAYNVPGLHPR